MRISAILEMRKPYQSHHEVFDVGNLTSMDPIDQFTAWFEAAVAANLGLYEANAMTVASASK